MRASSRPAASSHGNNIVFRDRNSLAHRVSEWSRAQRSTGFGRDASGRLPHAYRWARNPSPWLLLLMSAELGSAHVCSPLE